MPRRCSVCTHADHPAINLAMLNHRPFRRIASHFGLTTRSLYRHHDDHLPETLTKAKAAEETARADDLLEQLKALRSKAVALMLAAEKSGDVRAALAGVRETRACLELLLEVEQRIDRRPTVTLVLSPEWIAVRGVIMDVLCDDPPRRLELVRRLRAIGTES